MSKQVTVKNSLTFGTALWFLVVIAWRFLTGAHMNGKTYNDATWWLDASPMFRRRRSAYTWWRRKARMKRAAWRHSVFWPVLFVTLGLYFQLSWTLTIIGALAPFLFFVAFKRLRFAFFMPVVENTSDGGAVQGWILRPKYRRFLARISRRRDRPGIATREQLAKVPRLKDVSSSVRNAVALEVADELEGEPPTRLKLLLAPDDGEP